MKGLARSPPWPALASISRPASVTPRSHIRTISNSSKSPCRETSRPPKPSRPPRPPRKSRSRPGERLAEGIIETVENIVAIGAQQRRRRDAARVVPVRARQQAHETPRLEPLELDERGLG